MLTGCIDLDDNPNTQSTASSGNSDDSSQTAPSQGSIAAPAPSSNEGDGETELPDVNVALASASTTITSSYSSGNEVFLIDDQDSLDDEYWVPGDTGDYVTLTFDSNKSLQGISLLHSGLAITSESSDLVSTFNFDISYSTNGSTFTPVDLDEYCDLINFVSSNLSTNSFDCYSSIMLTAKLLRVTLHSTDDTKLYEVRAFTY